MTIRKANDAFPHFDLQHVDPEFDPSCQNQNDLKAQQERFFTTKEDQDVAVFMEISKKLSFHSLLHLLQDHARSQTHVLPPSKKPKTSNSTSMPVTPTASPQAAEAPQPAPAPEKKFRFAESLEQVHFIDSFKQERQLWWADTEMNAIRKNAIEIVLFFRQNCPEFKQAVGTILEAAKNDDTSSDQLPSKPDPVLQEMTKKWGKATRGLETHICDMLSQARADTVRAVLEEQAECRNCQDSPEVMQQSLRGQSCAYSAASRNFAAQMAQADHLEALKATLAEWKK